MNKFVSLVIGMVFALTVTSQVYAAKNVTVRINQPKSPVNQTSFDIGFTTLDLLGRSVNVTCLKKAPADSGFSSYGAVQTFTGGGNSGTCHIDGSIIGAEGNYAFRVDATAGEGTGDDADSDETAVTFDNSGPGQVREYSKNKTNACEYTIGFKTANDTGATVKVELYRSDAVPFFADHNSRIQSMNVGSDESKVTTDTPSDCNKTYYYALRAFDSAGNGSALVGDNVSTVTVINPTGTPKQGAIPVSGSVTSAKAGGSVLGQEISGSAGPTGSAGQVEGTSAAIPTQPEVADAQTPSKPYYIAHYKRSLAIAGLLILAGGLVYYLWKRKNGTS